MDESSEKKEDMVYHTPALLPECMEALDIKPEGIYADATFGGGGHSRAILERLSPEGHLFGFDQDMEAFANNIDDPRFTFVHSNFEYMPNFLRFHGVDKADGILADLGVSFHHFDDPSRGFSFRSDSPLDMRMNRQASRSAADVVNDCDEDTLIRILRLGSDLKKAPQFARALIVARNRKPIVTTGNLLEAVKPLLNPKSEKKDLAQLFQALRIEVNDELGVLVRFLENSSRILRPGGRLAIITYHSLEDRLVKNLMKTGNVEGELDKDFFGNINTPWKAITRNPITPSAEEVERNPRARSAKLRVAELKLSDNLSI